MSSNPFTAKAKKKTKLRKFGGTKASSNGKVQKQKISPWVKKIEARKEAEMRGILHPGSAKADFVRDGIKFGNCRDHGGWWSVDVSTGDKTVTFHNRYGSWMADVDGEGRMREPVREVAFGCNARYITELKRIGAELPLYLRPEKDKREAERNKAKDESEDAPKKGRKNAARAT